MLLKLKPLLLESSGGKGVVYAGAHQGQCIEEFIACGFNRILFIEPDEHNCSVIREKMMKHPDPCIVFHIAQCVAGASNDIKVGMYTECRNKGQSNSILKPKLHIKQYPDIIFSERPKGEYQMKTIDQIIKDAKMYPHQFHMLYMDLQGYELEAIKGAASLLKAVDYVYSEVSREELYEGCAMFNDLEKELDMLGFSCKSVYWGGTTWGDALFVKKASDTGNSISSPIAINKTKNYAEIVNNRVTVPDEFRQSVKKPYPEDNDIIFEQFFDIFWRHFSIRSNAVHKPIKEIEKDILFYTGYIKNLDFVDDSSRVYLPVYWTSYYMNNGYGGNKPAMQRLQDFIKTLDPSVPYFTIVQYDDGILNDLSGLDCKIYGMGGGKMDYTIPLISRSRTCIATDKPRKYLANFIGKVTHPVRQKLIDELSGKDGMYISTDNHTIDQYTQVIADSQFTLTPRGYGLTSFRIKEAVEQLSIPVYISDQFLLPEYLKNNHTGINLLATGKIINNQNINYAMVLTNNEHITALYEYLNYMAVKNNISGAISKHAADYFYSFKGVAAEIANSLVF